MPTQAELDEDERELAEFRRRSGIPEPKQGRPPLRRTPKGASYSQGRPRTPAPASSAPAPAPAPARARRAPARATDAPAPASTPPAPARGSGGVLQDKAGRVGSGAAGLVVGLFAWGFVMNAIRGGWSQGAGWFGAKFFNEPYGAAKAPASSAPAPTLRRGATAPAPASTTG